MIGEIGGVDAMAIIFTNPQHYTEFFFLDLVTGVLGQVISDVGVCFLHNCHRAVSVVIKGAKNGYDLHGVKWLLVYMAREAGLGLLRVNSRRELGRLLELLEGR